jgi:catechol 2,3-dioxygenase-like lactoylglutathione lyase family enzyme
MKINKIQLHSYQLNELQDFYTQVLDFQLINCTQHSFSVQTGQSVLEFKLADSHHWGNLNYHFAFNIPENQIELSLAWLKHKKIEVLSSDNQAIIPFSNWNAHALYFFDPAGNVVELIARHDLPNASKAPFSGQSILQISEIGLPVPAIAPFFEALNEHFKLPMYSQISNLTTFCASGDAEGLLIIVPLQRAWFPTSQVNGIFPLKICLQDEPEKVMAFEDLPYQITTEKL